LAFWSDMNCQILVNELGHDQPKMMKELLDITTRHASSEEVVRAIFVHGDGKVAHDNSRGAPLKAVVKGTKRSAKGDKLRRPKR
jgi:hypothetical protein